MNIQRRNRANLGDRLKHAALLHLLDCVSGQACQGVLYLDTHCFLIETAFADSVEWQRAVAQDLIRYPQSLAYVEAERSHVARGRYRCSAGLAIDRLRGRPAIWVLGEADPETRRELEVQLAHERICPHMLVADARELADIVPPNGYDAMFALVDPFVLDFDLWTDVSRGLERLTASGAVAIIEVFTYDKHREHAVWPVSSPGLEGPVSTIDRGPFHLAVYASPSLSEEARARCRALGWADARGGPPAGRPAA